MSGRGMWSVRAVIPATLAGVGLCVASATGLWWSEDERTAAGVGASGGAGGAVAGAADAGTTAAGSGAAVAPGPAATGAATTTCADRVEGRRPVLEEQAGTGDATAAPLVRTLWSTAALPGDLAVAVLPLVRAASELAIPVVPAGREAPLLLPRATARTHPGDRPDPGSATARPESPPSATVDGGRPTGRPAAMTDAPDPRLLPGEGPAGVVDGEATDDDGVNGDRVNGDGAAVDGVRRGGLHAGAPEAPDPSVGTGRIGPTATPVGDQHRPAATPAATPVAPG